MEVSFCSQVKLLKGWGFLLALLLYNNLIWGKGKFVGVYQYVNNIVMPECIGVYLQGEQPCRLRLGGHQVTITTHVFSRPGGKRYLEEIDIYF